MTPSFPAELSQTGPHRVDDLIREDRVHGSFYTAPDVFDWEMEHLFRRGWVYVAHESEAPNRGDYLTLKIGGQPLVLTRHTDDTLYLLFDRCPHRGNKICRLAKGNTRLFDCSYHGWVFDTRGGLVNMPAPQDLPPGADPADRSMARVPRLETYGGFVFASLAPSGISLEAHLGRAALMIDMLNGLSPEGKIRFDAGWMRHRLRGNWKCLYENQVDGYHPQIVHGSLLRANQGFASVRDRKDTSAARAIDLGGGNSELDLAADFQARDVLMGWTGGPDPDRLPKYLAAMREAYGEAEARRRLILGPPHGVIFPNLLLAEMNVMVIEPVTVGETIQSTTPVMIEGGAELNPRTLRRCEGAMGPAGFLIADDAEIAASCQAGLGADLPQWVRLDRGLGQDEVRQDGALVGMLKDETAQRGFWRHYKSVLQQAAQ